MSSVEERVKKLICEQLGVKDDEVKDDASFVEDLGADSLDTVELVMALEEEFAVALPCPEPSPLFASPEESPWEPSLTCAFPPAQAVKAHTSAHNSTHPKQRAKE